MIQRPENKQPLVAASPSEIKYRNARSSLLTVLLLSVINIFTIAFSDIYFVFSSSFSQYLSWLGVAFAQELENNTFLIIFSIVALITLIPYLLCWIFSKKHVGWMIAAVVIFSFDFAFLLLLTPASITGGDFSIFLDLAMHVWALVSMALGIKNGFAMKKEAAEAANAPAAQTDPFLNDLSDFETQDNTPQE